MANDMQLGLMRYIGDYMQLPHHAEAGDVVTIGQEPWVYTGVTWEQIGSCGYEEEEENMTANCRNCGSPLIYLGRCQYCGSIQPTRKIRRTFST